MPDTDQVQFVSADEAASQFSTDENTDTEDLDVDFDGDTSDDELEDVPESAAATNGEAKPAKAKKEPARGDLPDGYVTPVGLAHELNRLKLGKTDEDGNYVDIPPQQVYSYIRNAPKDYPFPIEVIKDSLDKDRQVVKTEAGVQWWKDKNERAAARKTNAAEKAKKAAEKAQAKATETPVVEAEEASAVEAE